MRFLIFCYRLFVVVALFFALWFTVDTNLALQQDYTLARQWRGQATELRAENEQLYGELRKIVEEREKLSEALYKARVRLEHAEQGRRF